MKPRKMNYIGIFCVFCLMAFVISISMLIIFTGANSYNHIKSGTQSVYSGNTALNYIANKIRSFDNGNIEVSEDNNYIALYDDSKMYKTIIYEYDGYLYENIMQANKEFAIGKGNKIIEADNLEFSVLSSQILKIELTSEKTEYDVCISINAGEINRTTDEVGGKLDEK